MSANRSVEKYLKKLIGKKEMEDALKRLDKLTQEEARMATAETLRLTQIVDNKVTAVDNKVMTVDNKVTTAVNGEPRVNNWLYLLNARALVRRQRNKASCPENSMQRRRHKMFVIHPVASASDNPSFRRAPSEGEPKKVGYFPRSVNKSHHRMRYPTRWIRSVVLSRQHIFRMEIH